jgi:peptide deformylase
MKLELITSPNKLLEMVCEPVLQVTPRLKEVIASMFIHMKRWGGIGLSAPQIGRLQQFLIANDGNRKIVLINPEITNVSETLVPYKEGCLSFPKRFITIQRPEWVQIEYMNINGEMMNERFHGLMARILQHEIEHLNGITFDKKT